MDFSHSICRNVLSHDPNIFSETNNLFSECLDDGLFDFKLQKFSQSDHAVSFLLDTKDKWLFITSGKNGKEFVQAVHELDSIIGIIVFCQFKEYHQSWAKDFAKIEAVHDNFFEIPSLFEGIINKYITLGAIGKGHKGYNNTLAVYNPSYSNPMKGVQSDWNGYLVKKMLHWTFL